MYSPQSEIREYLHSCTERFGILPHIQWSSDMIESQITYILDCLCTMNRRALQSVEVRPASEEAFNTEMQRRMKGTVWTSGCASWYLDSNERNTTLWPGFTFEFRRRTRHFDPQHYDLIPREACARTILL